uniref:Uncharacterized protein n=1 Tax=Ciona savignyi TaxID=51511 RepID=H2Z9V0_CIOSA
MGTPQEASNMEKSLISTVTNVIAKTTDVPTELRHQSEGNPTDGHTTLTLQSLPAGAIRKHPHPDNFNVSIDQIKSENHQLRRKMQHMESLGIIVTNLKQESLTLKEENVKLRRQIEEMNHNLVSCKLESNNIQKLDKKFCDSDDIVQSHDESNQSTSSSGAELSSQPENAPSLLDSTSGDASVLNHVTRKTQNPKLGPEESDLLTSLISSVSSNHGNSETHQERAAST